MLCRPMNTQKLLDIASQNNIREYVYACLHFII